MQTTSRPVFLNLLQIRLPLTGWVSIIHRVTGVVLFLALPVPLYLLQLSLSGEEGFQRVSAWLGQWPLKVLLLLLMWWFLHHLFAGIRVLLLDLEVGIDLAAARRSARWVLLADIVVLLLLGGALL